MGTDYTSSFDQQDIASNKGISLVAYILFFIPLIVAPNSKFARFHANQGLIIFILGFFSSILQGIFSFGSWSWQWSRSWSNWSNWFFNPFSIIFGLFGLILFAGIVYGIVNAVNGRAIELPLIGKFRILT
ncbi:MAG: hypothetical protein LBC82_04555 [Oscillospiraceae bacterium]|jgi:uncharacterized membrane protein|nr:hypothetical protein [Oscillospiraceae bacterium]